MRNNHRRGHHRSSSTRSDREPGAVVPHALKRALDVPERRSAAYVRQRRGSSLRSFPVDAVRLHEVTGESRRSFDAAVKDAIKRGRKQVRDVVGVEIVRLGGAVSDGRLRSYRATVRLAYRERVTTSLPEKGNDLGPA